MNKFFFVILNIIVVHFDSLISRFVNIFADNLLTIMLIVRERMIDGLLIQ